MCLQERLKIRGCKTLLAPGQRVGIVPNTPNINDTALIFEGGGMRASYTAGVVVTLLEEGLLFADVYGISAGSSHTVNYISGDIRRSKESFVDFMGEPGTSGLRTFLTGKGYFNARYIYQEACMPGEKLVFDFDAFCANPACAHIESFDATAGETVYWTKADMPDLYMLMTRVRASSTMPWFMPAVVLDGHLYYDGGIGDSWGLPLAQAKRDGYKKFFVVRTQERGYRKSQDKHPMLTRALFPRKKILAERMLNRWRCYNEILDELDALERDGKAIVFCPEHMTIKNTTTKPELLEASYAAGYAQAQRELPGWRSLF